MFGSAADVRTMTGIRPEDFRAGTFADVAALDSWLNSRLEGISTLMLQDRNYEEADITTEGWVDAWDDIATRWCVELIHFVMASRDSPIIHVDDFVVETPSDKVPGPAVIRDLRRFRRKVTKRRVFEISRVRKTDEMTS